MFIITGSMIIPAISPGLVEQDPAHGVEVAERHDERGRGDAGRHRARARRTGLRSVGRAGGGDSSGYTETCTASWWPW